MKNFLLTIILIFVSISYTYPQIKPDSSDNIKSRFGVGLGGAVDLKSNKSNQTLVSFHLRFTLKPITKYLFIEFATNIYPEYVKHENILREERTTDISFSPLFGKSIINNNIFLYCGPSIDLISHLILGYSLTFRGDYSITKIFTIGVNLKVMFTDNSQNFNFQHSNFLLGNINMSFTL
jgi:hypothetical protein